MHLFGQRTLGIGMLLLLMMLVVVKYAATGSIIRDKPKGSFWLWLVHLFNLFFLLIANPLAALLLATGQMEVIDPTHISIDTPWLLVALETGGVVFYVLGYLLMAWALLRLKSNYQAGGSDPRISDAMVQAGPYRFLRHPMYAAALGISLGLAGLVQSMAYLTVFCIYLILIARLIPFEEEKLGRAYGESYRTYQRKTRRLIPFVY